MENEIKKLKLDFIPALFLSVRLSAKKIRQK